MNYEPPARIGFFHQITAISKGGNNLGEVTTVGPFIYNPNRLGQEIYAKRDVNWAIMSYNWHLTSDLIAPFMRSWAKAPQ